MPAVWNTCYILFYPYLQEDSDLRQRYLLDLDAASARSPLPWQPQTRQKSDDTAQNPRLGRLKFGAMAAHGAHS